jgi:hypothetical protein
MKSDRRAALCASPGKASEDFCRTLRVPRLRHDNYGIDATQGSRQKMLIMARPLTIARGSDVILACQRVPPHEDCPVGIEHGKEKVDDVVSVRSRAGADSRLLESAMSRRDRSVLPAQSSRSMRSTDTSVILPA